MFQFARRRKDGGADYGNDELRKHLEGWSKNAENPHESVEFGGGAVFLETAPFNPF